MPDRENVIAALGCTGNECENCPYHVVQSDELGTWGWCDVEKLDIDAIALLREQEPVEPKCHVTVIRSRGSDGFREDWEMKTFTCALCGHVVKRDENNFCGYCGRAVKWDG